MFNDVDNKKINNGEDKPSSLGLLKNNTELPNPSLAQFKNSSQPSEKKPAEDIFSEIDKSADSQPAKPAVFQPKEQKKSDSPVNNKENKDMPKHINDVKKYFIFAVIIFGLVLVGFVGYWAYGHFFKAVGPVSEEINNEFEEQIGDTKKETTKQSEEKKEITPTPVRPTDASASPVQDSDQDGLTNDEEEQLGTDTESVDSDDDGLFDREEVKVYKTDPLNADTDGDGYLDGDEVKSGYNPKGPGKLYEIK